MQSKDEMTDQDFNHLQLLLGKLMGHLNHRISVVPGIIQDLYHIGIYGQDGNIIDSETGFGLKDAATKLLTRNPRKP